MVIHNELYTNWEKYRLSDMLRNPRVRYGACNIKKYKSEYERYLIEFPNSIATKYISTLSESEKELGGVELNKLTRILQSFPKVEQDEKSIYIHLRIGDVCVADNDVRFNRRMTPQEICYHGVLLKYGNKEKYYCNPWCHYDKKIKECVKNGANKRIIIVSGMHTLDKGIEESKEVIRLYKLQLEQNGYEVDLHIGNTPDSDFILLYRANYFIEGGGGYGELIRVCRETEVNI
jgi:hypothetical protein